MSTERERTDYQKARSGRLRIPNAMAVFKFPNRPSKTQINEFSGRKVMLVNRDRFKHRPKPVDLFIGTLKIK